MVLEMLGKKLGMTQMFTENGDRVPVTVLEVGPCTVQVVKTEEKDGYSAVQLGYSDIKDKKLNKPQREYNKANKLPAKKVVREVNCDSAEEVKVGDLITNSIFQQGDFVDITGQSKGKGFQGGMKRHNWNGGRETHGSNSKRAPGSIGASSFPSRVFKGQRMPGHMGAEKSMTQNLEIIEVNTENNTVVVKGAVPGANGGFLVVRYAKKKPLAPRVKLEKNVSEETTEENKEGSK